MVQVMCAILEDAKQIREGKATLLQGEVLPDRALTHWLTECVRGRWALNNNTPAPLSSSRYADLEVMYRLAYGVFNVMGVILQDRSDDPNCSADAVREADIDELVTELRGSDSEETGMLLTVAAEAVRRHLDDGTNSDNLLLVRRLARKRRGRRYRRLMKATAEAMEDGAEGARAALATISRVIGLAFKNSPDATKAKRKHETMLSEVKRSKREEGYWNAL